MAKTTDFDDFSTDDFDSLVEADAEEVPEETEEEEDTPRTRAERELKKVPVPTPAKKTVPIKRPEPIQEDEPVSPREIPRRKEKVQAPRYTAYKTEKRYGLIDNITGQPMADATDIETLTLTILSDILNKLDRIEASL